MPADAYIEALWAEYERAGLRGAAFSTIFIGGGTPSVLSIPQLRRLLSMLPIVEASETTIEMNPESTDTEKLVLLRDLGISRLSFGVQTFSPHGLRLLGRAHDADTARQSISDAVKAGFHSINIDLICGWPGQTLESLGLDIATGANLGVAHISCYNLTLHPESRLAAIMEHNGLKMPGDDEARSFWDATGTAMRKAGLDHYEISNYAKPGFHCRHNCAIWRGGEYYGIGLAAHSHVGGRRYWNTENLEQYLDCIAKGQDATEGGEILPRYEKAKETAIFWLRLAEGIEADLFAEKTGYRIEKLYERELPHLLAAGLLEWYRRNGRKCLRLTKAAYPVADSVLVDLA
jgi:oxygen-independent coproporphyrinogen-3 oxidase